MSNVMEMGGYFGQDTADTVSTVVVPPAGDGEFTAVFEGCRPRLIKLCQRILGDADGALDAVSETYLHAWRGRAVFDGRNFPGWLSRIAQHICLDRLRRRFPCESSDAVTDAASWETEVRLLTAIDIRAILASLPKKQSRCLKLFYIEGLTAKEVARFTRFKEKEVKSYLQHGRRNFIKAWKAMENKRNG